MSEESDLVIKVERLEESRKALADAFFEATGYTLQRFMDALALMEKCVPNATMKQKREAAKKIAKSMSFLDE